MYFKSHKNKLKLLSQPLSHSLYKFILHTLIKQSIFLQFFSQIIPNQFLILRQIISLMLCLD